MKSFTEREVMLSAVLEHLHWATAYVAGIPPGLGKKIRCHELARVVGELRNLPVIDGKYGAVEHSWLVVRAPNAALGTPMPRPVVLDVYVPGRVPQVQLIDTFPLLPDAGFYVPGEVRTDIDAELVFRMVEFYRAEPSPSLYDR